MGWPVRPRCTWRSTSLPSAEPDPARYRDAHLYPILRDALHVAGRVIEALPPHDPAALATRLRGVGRFPVVFTHGRCIDCGRAAPLADYVAILRPRVGCWLWMTPRRSACLAHQARGPSGRVAGARCAPKRWTKAIPWWQ